MDLEQEKKLNLSEGIAIGVGGMVGGGIFSVLGLAASIAGHASVLSFVFGGVVALLTGVSYSHLGLRYRSEGGSFTYLKEGFSNPDIARMGGWLLVIGYLGTLSLYAYTFGAYGSSMIGEIIPGSFDLWRRVLASSVILVFMAVNLQGAKTTGATELLIVVIKVLILAFFAVIGFTSVKPENILPVFDKGLTNLVIASALIFVAYEGFELIPNAIDELKDPDNDLRKSIMYSILITMTIYVSVAFVAVGNLTPKQILKYKEYALAIAASERLHDLGFVLIGVAALFSTSSAINATMFGTARLMYDMATKNDLPSSFAIKDRSHGVPFVSLAAVSISTLFFVNIGTLNQIASFASVTFLVIFTAINFVAFKLRRVIEINWIWPLIGFMLAMLSLGILLSYLLITDWSTFVFIMAVYIIMIVGDLWFVGKEKWTDYPLEAKDELSQ